jgi:type VI secretion system secreted protein Hcp
VSQSGSSGFGGGGGAGKAQFQDFHLTMQTSKASPNLFKKCVTGEHIKEGVITCRKAGGDNVGQDFLKFTLSDVLISSYSVNGDAHSDNGPEDAINLSFAKVLMSFAEQDLKGGLLPAIEAGFDLKQNKAI